LPVNPNEKLIDLHKDSDAFTVTTNKGSYAAKNVILALGRRGIPRKLGIEGEEKPKVMYNLIDAETYRHEHLLVVGGGDSAIEAAMGLAIQPDATVTLSYRKEKFFRIKKRNQQRIDDLAKKNNLQIEFESQVEKIEDDRVILNTKSGQKTIANNYVFIFAGGEPPFDMLKKMGIKFGQI
jgi:thioredoxin reductase (NADPH)